MITYRATIISSILCASSSSTLSFFICPLKLKSKKHLKSKASMRLRYIGYRWEIEILIHNKEVTSTFIDLKPNLSIKYR